MLVFWIRMVGIVNDSHPAVLFQRLYLAGAERRLPEDDVEGGDELVQCGKRIDKVHVVCDSGFRGQAEERDALVFPPGGPQGVGAGWTESHGEHRKKPTPPQFRPTGCALPGRFPFGYVGFFETRSARIYLTVYQSKGTPIRGRGRRADRGLAASLRAARTSRHGCYLGRHFLARPSISEIRAGSRELISLFFLSNARCFNFPWARSMARINQK